MKVPDWQQLGLHAGVLPEATGQDGRLVLWVPGTRDGPFQHWERIGTVPRAAFTVEQGLCAIPAIATPLRQRARGLVGKFFQRLRRAPGDEAWTLPNGELAEPWRPRQTDLLLVWAVDHQPAQSGSHRNSMAGGETVSAARSKPLSGFRRGAAGSKQRSCPAAAGA